MKKNFRLDKRNAVFLGVCAGIADFTGLNATAVRIGAIVVTLLGGFPWTFIAYGVTAWLAKPEGWGDRSDRIGSSDPARHNRERRLDEVDRYVAAHNSSLAREIDSLR